MITFKKSGFKRKRISAGKTAVLPVKRSSLAERSSDAIYHQLEWQRWMIRMGLTPDAGMGVSRTGLYTDFT